jgi:hypothetical protein
MDGEPAPTAGFELEAMRGVADSSLSIPELEPPPIVIAADHQDRHLSREGGKGGGGPKSMSRHYRSIRKPELEQVAVHQQRIAP